MKRILLVVFEFPPGPGGVGMHAYTLAKFLSSSGFKINIVTSSNYSKSSIIKEFDSKNSKYYQIQRIVGNGMVSYLSRIFWIVLYSLKTDTILLSAKFPIWCGFLVRIFNWKSKVICIVHGSELGLIGVKRKLLEFNLKLSSHIICVSQFTKNLLIGRDKSLVNKVSVIYNGINLNDIGNLNDRSFDFEKIILLTVGNVNKRKGQDRVINAMPDLLKSFPGIMYNLVGLPTEYEAFKQLSLKKGIRNQVNFKGSVSRTKLSEEFRNATIFILLSRNLPDGQVEGFGIAILEANSYGIPAIGSKGTGIEEAIKDGYNGILINGDSSVDLRNAIQIILDNYTSFSNNARVWAGKHSVENMLGKYKEIIS